MPVWPKSIYTFRANLQTAAAEWQLRRKRAAVGAQSRTFAALAERLAATSFWREAGVVRGMEYAAFQDRLPLRGYEQFAPAIGRTLRGEPDVLWPGRCAFFAASAGTASGSPNLLPVTAEMLAHYRRAGLDSLLYYTVRARHAAIFRGRHLFLGGSTALTPLEEAKPSEAYRGDLAGLTALNLPPWVERHLYEPGAAIDRLADWPAKLAAIVQRTRSLDITLLAGLPNWTLALAAALRADAARSGRAHDHLQQLWPNLECFVHTGLPVGPFQDELRAVLGPTVTFHEVYPAPEGFVAAQDSDALRGLRLLADAGIFYEFLPMADFDESRLEQLGRKAVPLAGVTTGVDYALVMTTPAGLARYVVGDVVRFTSTVPPRLVYVGRTRLRLHAFDENVIEKEITDALVALSRKQGWTIVNFHVAPLFISSLTGQNRGRHEWWVELRPGTATTPTGPQMAAALDVALQKLNTGYDARRKAGALEAPIVRLVMPGVFEHWLRYKERWGGQHRLPRCRSDRLIADELAQITAFAPD